MFFYDRTEAGKQLAHALSHYKRQPETIVLALPRGGVPVASEIAHALQLPLDIVMVRKLGVPGQEELAMGAIANGHVRVMNEEIIQQLKIPEASIAKVIAEEHAELNRRSKAYRQGELAPDLKGRTIILVDDGCATGSNMKAAVQAVRHQLPAHIVIAVPVASESAYHMLCDLTDEVVCLSVPDPFYGVGRFYSDFAQISDEHVKTLLTTARAEINQRGFHMYQNAQRDLIATLSQEAIALRGDPHDYDALIDKVKDARFVLMGESTHGTEEFYRIRAELTKRLIQDHGFAAVAVEGDWPDCYRVNRYVRGEQKIRSANSALREFLRFPNWMWRNDIAVDFVDWLRDYNQAHSRPQDKIGFYGLDLYCLYDSIQAIIAYLDQNDLEAAQRARQFYACFDHGHRLALDPQKYGYATTMGVTPACEKQAIEMLVELRRKSSDYMQRNGFAAGEDYFCADRNAQTVLDAEHYYREIFKSRVSSWNLRDKHMVETLYAVQEHLSNWRDARAKIIVWAHNSHIGDARATEMGETGEWNIGSLLREAHGSDAALIGFSTYQGSVTAASVWEGEAERKLVLPAIKESYEHLFHQTGMGDFLLLLKDNPKLAPYLTLSRLQRAIGVLYLPQSERMSHYYFSKLTDQFDAIIHIDHSHALKPLETTGLWHETEMLETYPTGL